MEASLYNILHLPPGQYSRNRIDRQYRQVRRLIMREGGPDLQRRLDDALIARAMLRNPARQSVLVKRIRRDAVARLAHKPMQIPTRKRVICSSPTPPLAAAPKADAGGRFARMVVDHVSGGVLRLTSRRRLMTLAQGLGIDAFKANLIIAGVLHDLDHGRIPAGGAVAATRTEGTPRRPSAGYGWRIVAAVVAAITLNLLLLAWIG